MNQEASPILVGLLVAVLFVGANVGIMPGHALMQQESKTGGSTTTSNSSVLTTLFHSNNTSNSNSSNINKKVAPSNENPSQKLTKSLSASTKTLSISSQSAQTIVNGRGKLTISAIAYDATTGKKIENAVVKLKIIFTSNDTSKEMIGHNGEVTYSAELKPNSKGINNIDIRATVQAFAPGYISAAKTLLSSSSTSIITSNNSSKESIVNTNASSNLAQKILRNVQKKLEENGIDFSLGK
jgi:hypothetical protein